MSCPPRLYNSNYTWRRVQIMKLLVQIMKLLVMQVSPLSRYSILLWSKYSCSLQVLNKTHKYNI
jgi:hypothetical protein